MILKTDQKSQKSKEDELSILQNTPFLIFYFHSLSCALNHLSGISLRLA
jgi:hypothetical protein